MLLLQNYDLQSTHFDIREKLMQLISTIRLKTTETFSEAFKHISTMAVKIYFTNVISFAKVT